MVVMLRRIVVVAAALGLLCTLTVPSHATTGFDGNDVPGDEYDVASTSLTIERRDGVRWMTVEVRTYRGFQARLGQGWFEVRLDTWGAGKADFRMRMFGDPASGGGLYAPMSSLHGSWYGYARIMKTGAKELTAWFPVHWVHPNKSVRWYVIASVPGPYSPSDLPGMRDRAPDVGWYSM
jgi:hypothetical protein